MNQNATLPTVSVVIPTFNRGPIIEHTIQSALEQTLAPLEVIVVDDGSTDNTADFIEARFGDAVRLIRQPNRGVAHARNRGWRAASGEWIAFLDHDDHFLPSKLEIMLPVASDEVGVIVSRWREDGATEASEVVDTVEPPVFATQNLASQAAFDWLFGWHNPIVSMSVPLVRRDVLERVGGFDARCAPADDWDLWLRIARSGSDFAFVNEITTSYAIHEGQQRRDEARMFRAVRRTLSKHPVALARRPLLAWWLLWSGAFVPSLPSYERAKKGDRSALLAALGAALRAHPLSLLSPQWMALLARRVRRF